MKENIIMVAYGKCKCGLTPGDVSHYQLSYLYDALVKAAQGVARPGQGTHHI